MLNQCEICALAGFQDEPIGITRVCANSLRELSRINYSRADSQSNSLDSVVMLAVECRLLIQICRPVYRRGGAGREVAGGGVEVQFLPKEGRVKRSTISEIHTLLT
jgi:hypothetical protein